MIHFLLKSFWRKLTCYCLSQRLHPLYRVWRWYHLWLCLYLRLHHIAGCSHKNLSFSNFHRSSSRGTPRSSIRWSALKRSYHASMDWFASTFQFPAFARYLAPGGHRCHLEIGSLPTIWILLDSLFWVPRGSDSVWWCKEIFLDLRDSSRRKQVCDDPEVWSRDYGRQRVFLCYPGLAHIFW